MFLWWVEARSASEVVAVAVGDSSGLAHAAFLARVILFTACSSASANAAHPLWPRMTEPVAKLADSREF